MKIRRNVFRPLLRRPRKLQCTRSEWVRAALGAWYLAGVAAGAWMSRGTPDGAWRTAAFFAPHSWGAAIADAARPTVLFALALALTGLSLAGTVTAAGVLLIRGAGVGWLMGSLMQAGTSRAWLCALCYALPLSCWTAVLYLVQAREAMQMSAVLRRSVRTPSDAPLLRLRRYARRTGILLGMGLAGSLAQSVVAMAIRAYGGTA